MTNLWFIYIATGVIFIGIVVWLLNKAFFSDKKPKDSDDQS
jgi:hypothetical protein